MPAFPGSMILDLRYPIFQAPTGGTAGPELCAAVSAAGALGAMALSWTDPETAIEQIQRVKQATGNPFQVNFALAFEPVSLPAALEAGAPVVTFSWGMPNAHIAQVRAAGAKLGIQVANRDSARRALDLGVDFLICQGIEAGGHVQSTTSLLRLLPQIVEEAESVPVVAAGGIADGAAIAEVLRRGAAAAMLGTRFVATQESRAHERYKKRLVEGEDTSLTVCFDGGWPYGPHRVLRNETLEDWEGAGSPPVGKRPGEGDLLGHSAAGEPILRYDMAAPKMGTTGNVEGMCLYAGEGCRNIRDLPRAADLIERLWREAFEECSR